MNSRYLVIQLDIGQGTQWGNNKTINPIRDIFIPSVRSYCQKYNYDYSLIKESTYEKELFGEELDDGSLEAWTRAIAAFQVQDVDDDRL